MPLRGSYPHPVIDEADDVASDFEVLNVQVAPTQQDIEVSYEIRSDDPDLERLLAEGLAYHSLRWRCSSTISTGEMKPTVIRRTGTGYQLSAWLDQTLVKGDVRADVRVIVASSIPKHRWSRQHSDYGDARFDLRPGDVLVEGGALVFNAGKLYDPLDPPVGSCFEFKRIAHLHKKISLSFNGDEAVTVRIPAKTFDSLHHFVDRPDLQIGLIVLPALMQTLQFIRENRDQEPLDDKAWFRTIDGLVDELGGWDQTLLELAQKILDHPVDTAIRKSLFAEEED